MDKRLAQRIERAISSLTGNESLLSNLDTEAGQAMLAWSIEAARRIAGETEDLDDEAAEAAVSPRLHALRQLMRLVNRIAAGRVDQDTAPLLEAAFARAAIVFGPGYQPPSGQRRAFPPHGSDSPAGWIAALLDDLAPRDPQE
jgi:hypothetical protein